MKSRNPLLVEVTRGHAVESQHQVIAVIADHRGIVTDYWGNPDYVTYPRSSIKALQAIPFVESGAMEKFSLPESTLALACASHAGAPFQQEALREWMKKIDASESVLACGESLPKDSKGQQEILRKNGTPSRIFHNCSGKHLGIVSACLVQGIDPAGYEKNEHKIQLQIRKALSEQMRHDLSLFPPAIDGCGIPTYATPLQNVAIGMASFFNEKEVSVPRQKTLTQILQAWIRYPSYISNEDDFPHILAQKTQGRALLKSGAEGAYCGLAPGKKAAFALKVVDGRDRAAEIVSAYLFRLMGALTDPEVSDLKQWVTPTITNSRGEVVGSIKISGTAI